MTQLFYEQQVSNADSLYSFSLSGLSRRFISNGVVTGVLNQPIALAASNEFNTLRQALESAPLGIGTGTALINKGMDYQKVFTGTTTAIEFFQTKKTWRESGMPVIDLNITFWGLKTGVDRPIDKVKTLYSALFPTSSYKSFIVKAPRGYAPKILANDNIQDGADGTLGLSIGRWLKIGGLVAKSANFTQSSHLMRDGTPLFMTGNISLEPYRMITYGEFLTWFKQKKLKNVSSQEVGGTDLTSIQDNIGRA